VFQALVHIRGGDYISNSENTDNFGLLSPNYYSEVLKNLGVAEVVVSTDDLKWLTNFYEHFRISEVLDPTNSDEWDVFLAAVSSRIFLTSNSSLSWWAGFVASMSGTRVIIPQPWFKKDKSLIRLKFFKFDSAYSKWYASPPILKFDDQENNQ
jgi:hypothetical protein